MSSRQPAVSEECPCCHTYLAPGLDTDRALVAAFLGGTFARDAKIPIAAALCGRHAKMAADCMGFVVQNIEDLST